jgi:hypothetical protein
MDIALCIEKLIPSAKYGGSVTDNSKKSYDALRWEDERKKPTWEDLLLIDPVIQAEQVKITETEQLEAKVQAEIRNQAITSLQIKGEITKEQADTLSARRAA